MGEDIRDGAEEVMDDIMYSLFLHMLAGNAAYDLRRTVDSPLRDSQEYVLHIGVDRKATMKQYDRDQLSFGVMTSLTAAISKVFDRCNDRQEKIEFAERQMLHWADQMKKAQDG